MLRQWEVSRQHYAYNRSGRSRHLLKLRMLRTSHQTRSSFSKAHFRDDDPWWFSPDSSAFPGVDPDYFHSEAVIPLLTQFMNRTPT